MDDPDSSWPAWKFGMKRGDLFTTLHDQYNTFSFNIQDPEAFHHDVYEVSRDASTAGEFHSLMAIRQKQRLRELNESLESLAVEIIANPKLMASDQWRHALQLFRTKSFDSIVRYFASYLPDEYLSGHDSYSTSSSFSEADSIHTASTKTSSVNDAPYTFLDSKCCHSGPVMTEEPCPLDPLGGITDSIPAVDGPLSPPESEISQSDMSESSPPADSPPDYRAHSRSRSVSFSGSESERFCLPRQSLHDEDEASQSDDGDTPITCLSDVSDTRSIEVVDLVGDDKGHNIEQPIEIPDDDENDFPTAQHPEDEFDIFDTTTYDTLESDTPTPRQEPFTNSYVEYKSPALRRLPSPHCRSPSPRRCNPHGGERGGVHDIRRSPEEALSKIQKPLSEPLRKRLKGRRRPA